MMSRQEYTQSIAYLLGWSVLRDRQFGAFWSNEHWTCKFEEVKSVFLVRRWNCCMTITSEVHTTLHQICFFCFFPLMCIVVACWSLIASAFQETIVFTFVCWFATFASQLGTIFNYLYRTFVVRKSYCIFLNFIGTTILFMQTSVSWRNI